MYYETRENFKIAFAFVYFISFVNKKKKNLNGNRSLKLIKII